MPAFGTGPLLAGTAGLLLVCLLRTPFRWCGAILGIAAAYFVVMTQRPDVLVRTTGKPSQFVAGMEGLRCFTVLATIWRSRSGSPPTLGHERRMIQA
jgi:hypothetical protein